MKTDGYEYSMGQKYNEVSHLPLLLYIYKNPYCSFKLSITFQKWTLLCIISTMPFKKMKFSNILSFPGVFEVEDPSARGTAVVKQWSMGKFFKEIRVFAAQQLREGRHPKLALCLACLLHHLLWRIEKINDWMLRKCAMINTRIS